MSVLPLPDGPWSVAKGETPTGELLVVRLNRGFGEPASRGDLDSRLEVGIEIQGRDGVPSPQEYASLSEFEDSLVDQLSPSGAVAFAAVVTEGRRRIYVLYARDQDAAAQRIRELTQTPLRVSIAAYPDPTWSWYARFA